MNRPAALWAWRCQCGHITPPAPKKEAETLWREHLQHVPHRPHQDQPLF